MPIQLPQDSLLPFLPPPADILCGTDVLDYKFDASGLHILSQGTHPHKRDHGGVSYHRHIVAETSHTSDFELGELQEGFPELSHNLLPSKASQPVPTSLSFIAQRDTLYYYHRPQIKSATARESVMPKKRRSLQAILVPPFFQSAMAAEGVMTPTTPTSGSRLRSLSTTSTDLLPPAIPIPSIPETRPRTANTLRNSPPSDLLDDDPFANLSPAPVTTLIAETSTSQLPPPPLLTNVNTSTLPTGAPMSFPTPRSPLANGSIDASEEQNVPWLTPPRTPPPTPINGRSATAISRRPRSSGNGKTRSAYARPAFRSHPSLPSLNTLAQMHVIVPKVKRGRVGAQLPAEPWEALPSHTEPYNDYVDDATSDSRRFSGLSTIRDSRLYTSECDDESVVDSSSEVTSLDEDEIVRSTTPRASEANMISLGARPNPLVRAQSDPTPSRSSSSLSFTTDFPGFSDEIVSSPETSFPSTPQFPAAIPGHLSSQGHEGYHYITARFPRQATHSLYDDLAATLDYDYSQVVSQLHRRPSTLGIDISASILPEEEGECDFQPGTSARTIRSPFASDHQRTPSTQSIALDWTTEMDVNPLSPISTSSFVSSETTSSSGTSSEFGEEADFLSFQSDSDEESDGGSSEYISALGILPEIAGQAENTARLSSPYIRRRIVAGEEIMMEMSDSSCADITARLGQLDPSETESSQYQSAPEEVVDSGGGRRSNYSESKQLPSNHSQNHGVNGHSNSNGNDSGGGGGVGGQGGGGSGGGRRGRDDEDWNRRPAPRASAPSQDDSDTSEDEESSDDYGDQEAASRVTQPAMSSSPSGTDDDVPLAQKMPTALKAQRTIRRQIRDERDERRRARSLRRPGTSDRSNPVSPRPPLQPLPHDLPAPHSHLSSPKAKPFVPESITAPVKPKALNLHAPETHSASAPVGRPRTKTMPSQPTSPFNVGELTKKLLRVQTSSTSNNTLAVPPLPSASSRRSQDPSPIARSPIPRSPLLGKDVPLEATARMSATRTSQDPTGAQQRLMHMRSFHRPRTTTDEIAPPLPTSVSGSNLHRSATSTTRRPRDGPPPSSMPRPASREGRTSLDRARSTRSQSRRPSTDRSGRPSGEAARPPMPALISGDVLPVSTAYQQRIFVGTLQRYCQVELTSHSTAHDALEMLQNQGYLDGSATGWMIFELCQDFGMERPIRSYEVLSGVTSSWIADKTVNVLMAKRTLLAPKLSRAAIPSSSPMFSGFVQWEYKRGKWQKRWLELREHSLWVSKRESGKDQQMLCSLNNFDAYAVTRVSKAPKSFVFAVKSTDSLSFFESTTDYVHVFSCDEKDGLKWLESILLARSYVLHQERNILSSTAVTAPATSTGGGAALSRSGTRKRPAQPLLNLGQSTIPDPLAPPPPPTFEPGSLLAKRGV